MKQTNNALHMLTEAYRSIYRHALGQGMSNIRLGVLGNNLLKSLLILASIGTSYASTTMMNYYGQRDLLDVTPTITELSLTDGADVEVNGNLGHEMGWMINGAVKNDDGWSELKNDVLTSSGNYPNAVALLNSANFQNITTYGLQGNITLNSVTVNGGRAYLATQGGTLTVNGESKVNSGYLKINSLNTTATLNGKLTYSGIGSGGLDGKIELKNGLLIEDSASVDLDGVDLNVTGGEVVVTSKGAINENGFSDLEKQYGVWGHTISETVERYVSGYEGGGLQAGGGTSSITGNVIVDGGRINVGSWDDSSSTLENSPVLNLKGNVDVKNSGEIFVFGKKNYPAELNITGNFTVTGSGSVVKIGSTEDASSESKMTVNGNTVVSDGGKITVGKNGTAIFNGTATMDGTDSISIKKDTNGKIIFNGSTTFTRLTATDPTSDMTFESDATLTGASLDFNNLTFNGAATVNNSAIKANRVTLASLMKLDPSTLTTSSLLFSENGKLAVLTGSATYVGSSSDFASTDAVAEGYSLLALASGISLGSTNAIYLSGKENNSSAVDPAADSVTLKDGSTLELYKGAFANGAAITFTDGNGTFSVEKGAKIVLKGAQSTGKKVVVTGAGAGISTYTDSYADYLSSANFLYQINGVTATDGQYVIDLGISPAGVAAVSGGISKSLSQAIINQAQGSGFDSSRNDGQGLIASMLENIKTGSAEEIARFRNDANSFTGFIFGGVPLLNELVAQVAHDNVEQVNGFAVNSGAKAGTVSGSTATIWAKPFYKHSKSDSFKIEGSKYGLKANIYGLSLGADFAVANGFRLGFDGIVGHASTDSRGNLAPSEDSASFWGLGAYGTYEKDSLKILADIGYTAMKTDTDLKSSYGKMSSKNIDSYTLTAGINAKYRFSLTKVDIIPHAGIRFSHARIGSYKVKKGDALMLSGDSINQNYFQFPIGVEFSKEFTSGNWKLKPALDLTAIINAGDKDLDAKATISGFDGNFGKVSTNAEVLDSVSFRAGIGLDATCGAFGLGIGYTFTGSENVKEHVFAAGAKYSF
ncbi:MAG: autotransporter domain-containing protein [Succinivibrio sp.]|nr:autotransporter domain-containing protein [Succinivibrio sp.]